MLKNFAKFTGKHLCQSIFFNKSGLRPANLLKKRLWRNFEGHLYLQNTSCGCFCIFNVLSVKRDGMLQNVFIIQVPFINVCGIYFLLSNSDYPFLLAFLTFMFSPLFLGFSFLFILDYSWTFLEAPVWSWTLAGQIQKHLSWLLCFYLLFICWYTSIAIKIWKIKHDLIKLT